MIRELLQAKEDFLARLTLLLGVVIGAAMSALGGFWLTLVVAALAFVYTCLLAGLAIRKAVETSTGPMDDSAKP